MKNILIFEMKNILNVINSKKDIEGKIREFEDTVVEIILIKYRGRKD